MMFEETINHAQRIDYLLSKGIDPHNVYTALTMLRQIPITFRDGETWTLDKISHAIYKYKDQTIDDFKFCFKDNQNHKASFRSYFGSEKSKGAKVVNKYAQQLIFEWAAGANNPTPILDILEQKLKDME